MLKNKLFFWDMSLPKAIMAATVGAILGSAFTIGLSILLEEFF